MLTVVLTVVLTVMLTVVLTVILSMTDGAILLTSNHHVIASHHYHESRSVMVRLNTKFPSVESISSRQK